MKRSQFIACCRIRRAAAPARRKQIQTWRSTHAVVPRPKLESILDEEHFRSEIRPSAPPCSTPGALSGVRAAVSPLSSKCCPLMTPRYYSISSSPIADGTRCSITAASSRARRARDPASMRASAQPPGATGVRRPRCRLRQRDRVGFRCRDPAAPIVMIGRGQAWHLPRLPARTRRPQGARPQPGSGDAVLRLRHPEQDFIYADELRNTPGGYR